MREEVFTFPDGTEWDSSVVPDCTVSDLELELLGRSACPADSWLGGGQGDTIMTGFGGETVLDVDGFDNDAAVRPVTTRRARHHKSRRRARHRSGRVS